MLCFITALSVYLHYSISQIEFDFLYPNNTHIEEIGRLNV